MSVGNAGCEFARIIDRAAQQLGNGHGGRLRSQYELLIAI